MRRAPSLRLRAAPTPAAAWAADGSRRSAAPQAFAPAVAAAAPNPNRRVGTLGGGVLDLNPDGYGFLRSIERHFEPSPDDLFVPTALVRRYGLRLGSYIEGTIGLRADAAATTPSSASTASTASTRRPHSAVRSTSRSSPSTRPSST
jgi:hypothetical protein